MKELIPKTYCCPISKASYEFKQLAKEKTAFLYCNVSNTYVPIINGIIYFNERSIYISENECIETIDKLADKIGLNSYEYSEFVKQKNRRAYNDPYAGFQPFNEASKAFYPFINGLKSKLKSGDIILDVWNRTGWSTSFLASIFPNQKIISIWDKNKDVLGYKGYNFWFGQEKMPENVSVIFADLTAPLPFADNSISLTYAMDTLHWFPIETYLPELLRITKSNGANIFPHVHLANNNPNPFFERGGLQLHGEVYQAIFDKILPQHKKDGFVFSEPELFKLKATQEIKSSPSTSDYNGCLAVLPSDYNMKLEPLKLNDQEIANSRVVTNPFLKLNLSQSIIELDRDHFEGSVGHIIDRHPVYDEMLNKNNGYKLNELEVRLLYFGSKGHSLKDIASIIKTPIEKIIELASNFQQKDIVEILPLDETGFRLQHFHSTQEYLTPLKNQTLKHLWRDAAQRFGENNLLTSEFDESEFTYNELAELVDLISQRFIENGYKKGDKIAVYAPISPESTMLFWAAMQIGLIYIPISHILPSSQLESILESYNVKVIFTDKPLETTNSTTKNILLDSFEEDSKLTFFSEWLDSEALTEEFTEQDIFPNDEAVILFTSGSTGQPKGVVHSHDSLFRSGRLITENFHWIAKDKYLATADLDSMSGLRNCVIAPLHVGACIVIPNLEQRSHAVAISELINNQQITIISTTPTLLSQWLLMGKRIRSSLNTLKYIMCTGSNLLENLINEFEEVFKVPILNYYGLTETCGICIAVGRNEENFPKNTIGKAKGAIIQVVDDNEQVLPAGKEGNLRVLTENIFKSYYQNPEAYHQIVKNNWLYTGDTAIIDAEGWVNLKGRKRDIIKNSRGDLIYPLEIEAFIKKNKLVKDAHVCAITTDSIENIVAFIVLNTNENESDFKKEIVKDIELKLGKGKAPKIIKILSELPYNTNGKVNRNKLMTDIL